MPGLPQSTDFNDFDKINLFKMVSKARLSEKKDDYCHGNSEKLAEFYEEVMGYRFTAKPNYE